MRDHKTRKLGIINLELAIFSNQAHNEVFSSSLMKFGQKLILKNCLLKNIDPTTLNDRYLETRISNDGPFGRRSFDLTYIRHDNLVIIWFVYTSPIHKALGALQSINEI